MKHLFTVLSFILFFQLNTSGQKRFTEIGIFAGLANYYGDLSPNSQAMDPVFFTPVVGAFTRYNFNGYVSAKLHAYKAVLAGSDASAQVYRGNRARNLSFRTDLYELGLQVEVNFLEFLVHERDHITTPYLFIGAAGIYYNPQAQLGNQWVNLRELGTEGQGLPGYEAPYKVYSYAIPVGAGVKFNLNHLTNIGIEVGLRKSFTDYIDDVSGYYPNLQLLEQERGEVAARLSYRTPEYDNDIAVDNPEGTRRGNPGDTDYYFFGGITISVNIGKKSGFKNRQKRSGKRAKKAPKMEF
ncbi:MAG: DUF6089 family protein [Bacteroidota bacterium]